jgi:uncharacterized protein YjiS (DUF1127 family)
MTHPMKYALLERREHQFFSAIIGSAATFWSDWTFVRRSFNRMVQTVDLWHMRARGRRDLARLDDHFLRDIGLSRDEAAREARKPFWMS